MVARTSWVAGQALTGTGEVVFDLLVRDDGTGANHYGLRLEVDLANSTIDLKLIERSAGSAVALITSNDALTYVYGHIFEMICQIDTANLILRGKAWDSDTSIEPVDWTLEWDIVSLVTGGNYGCIRSSTPESSPSSPPS